MTKTITALIWAFLLVISTGCSNEEKEVPKKPSAAASSPVRVSDPPKDLKLATIGGNMCSLVSDGSVITLESLVALKRQRDSLKKGETTEALLREAEDGVKPRPKGEVIVEVPVSELAKAEDCDAWKSWRAYHLVLGALKPEVPDVTSNGGALMTTEVCALHSDGSAILAENLRAYERAKKAFKAGKLSEEKLREAELATRSIPKHELLVDPISVSKLPKGVTCDSWRRGQVKKFVWGGLRSS